MTTKDTQKYFYAAGRRKTSVAQVRLYPGGKGEVMINQRKLEEYFPLAEMRRIVVSPLSTVEQRKHFDLTVVVSGGGIRGQAEAVRHGVARALLEFDENLRLPLKKEGYLTRDPRAKERKKYGLKRARRAPQFSKR